jgi:hypothetical protein
MACSPFPLVFSSPSLMSTGSKPIDSRNSNDEIQRAESSDSRKAVAEEVAHRKRILCRPASKEFTSRTRSRCNQLRDLPPFVGSANSPS